MAVGRALIRLAVLVVAAAVATRAAEAAGVSRFQCGCEADCWCRQPGRSAFRWITPKRLHHLHDADDTAALAGD